MSKDIKEGYEIPITLKHEEKIFGGLTLQQLIYAVLAGISVLVIIKIFLFIPLKHEYKVVFGGMISFLTIGLFIILSIIRPEDHAKTIFNFVKNTNRLNRFDKEIENFISIKSIEYDHYFNIYDDACSMLRLYTITGDRENPINEDKVRQNDIDFLNSLPCDIQIIGHSIDYDIEQYIDNIIRNTKTLSDDLQNLMIGHIQHIKDYCEQNTTKTRNIYMIIKSPVDSINQIEKLNIDTKTIIEGLSNSWIIGRRLESNELTNTLLMMSTSLGKDGIDYLDYCTTMEDMSV